MSELEYKMVCPKCGRETIFLFSGSGTKGTCMSCGFNLPQQHTYSNYIGHIVSYNG